jgi:hypothetical protein
LIQATATVLNNGTPYSGQTVQFSSDASSVTVSGHLHTNTGTLFEVFESGPGQTASSCTTDANGQCSLFWVAPEISGVYSVTAACCGAISNPAQINVAVNLKPLTSSLIVPTGMYPNNASGSQHSDTHNGSSALLNAVLAMSLEYSQGSHALGVNDMSLPWGGILDIGNDWLTPHALHRSGTSVDIDHQEPNTGTLVIEPKLDGIACRLGLKRIPEGPKSIHYELRGCK